MPKIPHCVGVARLRHRCLLYSYNPHLICIVHPDGVDGDSCLDFREDPNAEPVELWEPEGATYYNGELILQPQQRWTQQQKLELLDWHPMFTGRCPQCSSEFDRGDTSRVHWDCKCGWMDDSI
ncbi:hypothetical protein CDG77_33475 [Nostoc sp. 'Peltigera membranacea cyanobiont' 213]|uniref:hypothetical protein n=1 Tax=unclassified Nostoc TaxID=2593658 RepID=UPI000B95A5A9|nr:MULTISPECIES: hypothetical protein [unclassified Nostoc]OYD86723.1 hypothetical protein CDG77_33475 [Nostoc sp. 'Peltigera membranacea cyanobiont' 213]